MHKIIKTLAAAALVSPWSVAANDVSEAERILCSVAEVTLCVEHGDCYDIPPTDIDLPRFIIIDRDEGTIETTRAADRQRRTTVSNMAEVGNRLLMQGIENGRAYSFVIEQDLGLLTAALARDGVTLSVFGACTDAKLD